MEDPILEVNFAFAPNAKFWYYPNVMKEGIYNAEGMREKRARAGAEIIKVIEKLQSEGFEINIAEETPETITIKTKAKDGKERTLGFMKMDGIEKNVEESVKNPSDYN